MHVCIASYIRAVYFNDTHLTIVSSRAGALVFRLRQVVESVRTTTVVVSTPLKARPNCLLKTRNSGGSRVDAGRRGGRVEARASETCTGNF